MIIVIINGRKKNVAYYSLLWTIATSMARPSAEILQPTKLNLSSAK